MEPKYLSFPFGDENHPLLVIWRSVIFRILKD